MGYLKRSRGLLVVAVVALGASLLAVVQPSAATPSAEAQPVDPCAEGGLANAGFESGALGGDPACWKVVRRADRVRVVGSEGPAQSPVYAQAGITVDPPRGSAMLALGNPKQQAESQAKDPDVVEQTFVAASAGFELQLRTFSWEPDGNDVVAVSIDGGAAVSLSLEDTPTYTSGSCSAGTCNYSIDTGNRNDKRLLDTGWRTATFTGMTVGEEYTVRITLGGTKRTAFATWGYVDDVSSPPVARFDLDRPEDCTFTSVGALYEGQPIPLNDCSYDPDGQIVDRQWTITFPNGLVAETDAPNGFIYPDDEGVYVVELTVTDDDGLTDTVVVGGSVDCVPPEGAAPTGVTASDGTCLPALVVNNAPALVDAVDVQAVAGSDVEIVARYGDAGIFDEHSVSVGGSDAARSGDGCRDLEVTATAPCFDEDDLPAVETGIVAGSATAPAVPGATIEIPVAVTDIATGAQPAPSSTTVDVATVQAIANDPLQFEPDPNADDRDEASRPVTLGTRYADWIDKPGDVDLFSVGWPGTDGVARKVPVGTELLVRLSDLPADFDVAVLVGRSGGTAPGQISPGQISPGQISPGQISPGQISPGQISPGQISPGQISPGQISPGQISPGQISPGQISTLYDLFTSSDGLAPYAVNPFQLYPLSLRAYTNASGVNLSGTDVDIDELGLGELAEGLEVAAYSANRGLGDDTVLVRVDEPETDVYVLVIGANNQFSNVEPYALQIEGSAPFDSTVLAAGQIDPNKLTLFGGTCERDDRGGAGTSSVATYGDLSGNRSTLFVTSRPRLEWADPSTNSIAWPKLEQLAMEVGGSILDVRSPAFATWDGQTCDPSAANAVADDVRDAVQANLDTGAYEYVVVVGGDDVIPFRRVVDETAYANETQYVSSSFLAPGQPIFASKAGGFNLTDAHLSDAVPTPWRGRSLWVGDLPTSRLVETELEIAAQVDAFLASDGVVDLDTTALVTGSEFFDDGAEAVASALEDGGVDVQRIIDAAGETGNELATAAQYKCAIFGIGCPSGQSALSGDINDVNAHHLHFATFSPKGAETADPAEVIGSTAVGEGAAGVLTGAFYMTIGCQAGLAVPDDEVQVDAVGPGLRASLDWAQALAQRQAVLIGNTGFGLGEDTGIAYTELLHQFIAEELLQQPTVGDALVAAQQRYLTSVTQFDEYHEKTLIQTTMYGLAFYAVPGTSAATGVQSLTSAPSAAAPLQAQVAGLTSTDAGTITTTGDLALSSDLVLVDADDRGSYYAADQVLATVERPKQPLIVADVPDGAAPVHGVLVRHDGAESEGFAGTYEDESGFDPVIQAPNSEWLSQGGEPQVCLDAWWPSTLAQVNTQDLGVGVPLRQTVSVKPGQFRCQSGASATVTGTQRLFDGLPLRLQRSDSADWKAPVVRQVDFEAGVAPGSIAVSMQLDTTDDLDRIVVLRLLGGYITSQDQVFQVQGRFVTFELPDVQVDEGFLIQLVDDAGNVTTYTGKSTVPSVIDIEASGPSFVVTGEPVTLRVTVPGYADQGLVEPVWYAWDFGAIVAFEGRSVSRVSGLITPGTTPGTSITFTPDGDAVIDVTVVYDESAPDPILATTRVVDSDGGIGVDRLTMWPACDVANLPDLPDADLVGCGLDFDATTGNGKPAVGFTVAVAGVISAEYQYRVGFDTDGNGSVDKTVKYDGGQLSGPIKKATAVIVGDGDELLITVPLADVVTACPGDPTRQCVIWQFETQGGVAGGQGQGFLDRARDSLTVTEVPSS